MCSLQYRPEMHHRKYEETSKERSKGTQNGAQKSRQSPGAVLGCKKAPKREPKWTPRAHKGPQYGSKGCQDGLKGGQICPTNSFKARRVFETAPGPILWRQKGPKMDPKWSPKPRTFSNLFVQQFGAPFGTCWGPKMDPIRDTTTWRRRR